MPQAWTADVVARMHLAKITTKQLAETAGLTPEYVSMLLNGHRNPESAEQRLKAALDELIHAQNQDVSEEG